MGHNYNTTINYGSPSFGLSQDEEIMQDISEQLDFSGIRDRAQQIYEAAEDSYGWAFDALSITLRSWLTEGGNMFWVSGKPGSGKSTFMKFLRYHQRTQELLQEWAKGESLVMADHYLWYACNNSSLKRSREGLYRSLLYQILEELPEATPILLPDRWKYRKKLRSRERNRNTAVEALLGPRSEWSTKELLDGLSRLAGISRACFVLFVDGLDEC